MEELMYIAVVIFIVWGIPMLYWGIKTNFSYYREREIEKEHIYTEVYDFFRGWEIRSIKIHPKRFQKLLKDTIESAAYKRICERIKR